MCFCIVYIVSSFSFPGGYLRRRPPGTEKMTALMVSVHGGCRMVYHICDVICYSVGHKFSLWVAQ